MKTTSENRNTLINYKDLLSLCNQQKLYLYKEHIGSTYTIFLCRWWAHVDKKMKFSLAGILANKTRTKPWRLSEKTITETIVNEKENQKVFKECSHPLKSQIWGKWFGSLGCQFWHVDTSCSSTFLTISFLIKRSQRPQVGQTGVNHHVLTLLYTPFSVIFGDIFIAGDHV